MENPRNMPILRALAQRITLWKKGASVHRVVDKRTLWVIFVFSRPDSCLRGMHRMHIFFFPQAPEEGVRQRLPKRINRFHSLWIKCMWMSENA